MRVKIKLIFCGDYEALIAINPAFEDLKVSLFWGLSDYIQKTELLKKLLEAYIENPQNDHKKIIFQALVKHGGCAVSWVTSEENVGFNIERLKDNNLKICGYFIKVAIPAVVVGVALLMEPAIKKAFRYVVAKIKASKKAATPAAPNKVDKTQDAEVILT